MINKTHISILAHIARGNFKSLTEIAAAIGIAKSTASESIAKLRELGILNDFKSWANNTVAFSLKKLFINNPYDFSFLADANMRILIALLHPLSMKELTEKTGYSRAQVFKSLRLFRKYGILGKIGKKYVVNGNIYGLRESLEEFGRYEQIKHAIVEVGNLVAEIGEYKLIEVPHYVSFEDGSLTAFSRYKEFGVDALFRNTYYITPKKSLSMQEIFDHSLLTATSAKERLLCIMFYLKNKEHLQKNELIENILKGTKVFGWPALQEVDEAKKDFGVD